MAAKRTSDLACPAIGKTSASKTTTIMDHLCMLRQYGRKLAVVVVLPSSPLVLCIAGPPPRVRDSDTHRHAEMPPTWASRTQTGSALSSIGRAAHDCVRMARIAGVAWTRQPCRRFRGPRLLIFSHCPRHAAPARAATITPKAETGER